MKHIFLRLCTGAVAAAMLFSLSGCQGRIDGRVQEEPDDFDWKQAVEDAVADKTNEKLNEVVNKIIPGASVDLELDGKRLDFSLCGVQELLDRDVTFSADMDANLEAGKTSGEISAKYGKLDFTVKVANLTDSVMKLQDCQVVSCKFSSGKLQLADGIDLLSAKRDDVEKLLGKPYRSTSTTSYYLLPAFDLNGVYHSQYSKYMRLEFKNDILSAIEFVIPSVVFHSLEGNVEDNCLNEVENLNNAQIFDLLQKKENICSLLKKEFDKRAINCSQDEESGAIVIDSAALFENNSYEVSDDCHELLTEISDAYLSVILSENVVGEIASVSFEGHASPEGDYEFNLVLSEKRADAVRKIFIDSLTEKDALIFEEMSTSEGYSYNVPKYDANGNVDCAASRRVEIRFNLHIK